MQLPLYWGTCSWDAVADAEYLLVLFRGTLVRVFSQIDSKRVVP